MKKILNLLVKDKYISGQKLALQLNISRTAVWKQIKTLKQLGYEIKAVKNKGYKLISKPDKPIPEEIKPLLNTDILGKKIIYLESVDSTNNYLKKTRNENTKEGTVIVADIQTSGRGRKNRFWHSPSGGLWFSFILYPNILPNDAMILTMACSVAIAKSIEKILNVKPIIKWPNDILVKNKKICGILTELDTELDKINHMIIGIGVNVNNQINRDLINQAISMKNIKKSNVSRVKLIATMLNFIDIYYKKTLNNNQNEIRKHWFEYSNIIGKYLEVTTENSKIRGKIIEVDKSGQIILSINNKNIKIISGDITYL